MTTDPHVDKPLSEYASEHSSEHKDPQWMKAYNSLTRYLGARDHSEKELRFKLSQKYPLPLVNEMIELAFKNNWMPDPFELAQRTTERLSERGKGSQYISMYLQKKGLPIIEISREDELQVARSTAEIKFGNLENLEYDDKPKVQRFLKSRGFQQDIINQVIFGRS